MNDTATAELVAAWENFSVPMRMRDGFNEASYVALKEALAACAVTWAESDTIPRLAVNVLVDILPTMDSFVEAYENPSMRTKIREAAFDLQELIWQCVAVEEA
ncbi:hypothetical protein ABUW04_07160 [Streptacidiphilus sp. N1-10]|uniref:Uncharacterized protein n=1 Tax=Streptacidiphilus jeojiensis TaxID=3229225 RepID=A0ABV6XIE3_9ACTN